MLCFELIQPWTALQNHPVIHAVIIAEHIKNSCINSVTAISNESDARNGTSFNDVTMIKESDTTIVTQDCIIAPCTSMHTGYCARHRITLHRNMILGEIIHGLGGTDRFVPDQF